ncbi:MAG: hypothetical protein JNL82_21890 [Myxococcales bacterium]|nr:hypothetical protein [Myxococcales bacterium]
MLAILLGFDAVTDGGVTPCRRVPGADVPFANDEANISVEPLLEAILTARRRDQDIVNVGDSLALTKGGAQVNEHRIAELFVFEGSEAVAQRESLVDRPYEILGVGAGDGAAELDRLRLGRTRGGVHEADGCREVGGVDEVHVSLKQPTATVGYLLELGLQVEL